MSKVWNLQKTRQSTMFHSELHVLINEWFKKHKVWRNWFGCSEETEKRQKRWVSIQTVTAVCSWSPLIKRRTVLLAEDYSWECCCSNGTKTFKNSSSHPCDSLHFCPACPNPESKCRRQGQKPHVPLTIVPRLLPDGEKTFQTSQHCCFENSFEGLTWYFFFFVSDKKCIHFIWPWMLFFFGVWSNGDDFKCLNSFWKCF